MEKLQPKFEKEPQIPLVRNQTTYLGTDASYPERLRVADADAGWNSDIDYDAPYFVHDAVLDAAGGWAQPEPETEEELMDKITAHLNPYGRTGILGRGKLGSWGPNYSSDPIVTRYNEAGQLELLTIRRGDSGALALPGGFNDADEPNVEAAAREAFEETSIAVDVESGTLVTEEYPMFASRNTDNAWVVTSATRWHLEGEAAQQEPVAGDDAAHAEWLVVNQDTMNTLLQGHAKMVEFALSQD